MSARTRNRMVAKRNARRHDAGVTQEVEPVYHLEEHIPPTLTLERRPTRDDREEELAQLRTADGRVMAKIERMDPASLPN